MEKSNLDVGLIEDLMTCLINLVSIENHATQSYYKTKDPQWLELKDIARQMRSKWLEAIVKKNNAEGWCITKHLLASHSTMEEVATRLSSDGKAEEAKEAFEDAGLLLGLIYAINDLKKGGNEDVSSKDATKKTAK